jgi:hypothetical protein
MRLIAIAILFITSVSCSKSKKSEDLSYDFEYNGCKTGKHSFASKAAMCDALQDDFLNKGCAYDMRKDFYEQKCI